MRTISDLKEQVDKYEREIQLFKVMSKPSTPQLFNPRPTINKPSKFMKEVKPEK